MLRPGRIASGSGHRKPCEWTSGHHATATDDAFDDLAALQASLAVATAKAAETEAGLPVALAKNADDPATIAEQRLEIAKLKRQIYGPRSERSARLLEQMELELEDAGAAATEAEIASERASTKSTTVAAFERRRPAR